MYTGKLRGFLEDGADDPESLAYKQLEELILAQVGGRDAGIRYVWPGVGEVQNVAFRTLSTTEPITSASLSPCFNAELRSQSMIVAGCILVRLYNLFTSKLFQSHSTVEIYKSSWATLASMLSFGSLQRSHSLPFVPDDPRFAALATAAWGQIKEEATEVPTREYWANVLVSRNLLTRDDILGNRRPILFREKSDLLARSDGLLRTFVRPFQGIRPFQKIA